MRITLLVATVTFGVVYVAMLIERYALRRGEADVDELLSLYFVAAASGSPP